MTEQYTDKIHNKSRHPCSEMRVVPFVKIHHEYKNVKIN